MRLAAIVERFEPALEQRYGHRLLPGARQALRAMKICQSQAAPHWLATCSQCPTAVALAHSCGHRSCPHCQYGVGERWLAQQRERLLPVDYSLVTFTLPGSLRQTAYRHQRPVYDAMMRSAWATLRQFAHNDPKLNGDIGATAVLHTHNRRRDLHPHVHLVVPAGSLNGKTALWRSKRRYLFNARNLAKVFMAKLLAELRELDLPLPQVPTRQWVADCRHVGGGEQALIYLCRYLYRGVLSERDIVACDQNSVSFRYLEAKTGQTQTRTLDGADFLWLLLQHVLPRGFRRVRDFGLLHHRRKILLQRIQCLLHMRLPPPAAKQPPKPLLCKHCGAPMRRGMTGMSRALALDQVRQVQAAWSKAM
jgi:hypothetical protein